MHGVFLILLITGTLLTALVAGLLFTFALIVMPGIRSLGDREYVRAFQEMDGIIQRKHPLFVLVWGGSTLLLLLSALFGIWVLDGIVSTLLPAAAAIYILGVQLPTGMVNLPLNNSLQKIDVETADEEAISVSRREFESRWTRWNLLRTGAAVGVTAGLLFVLIAI